MMLSELIKGLEIKTEDLRDINVSGISYDSRNVRQEDIFVAIRGFKDNGGNYIKEAIRKGAVAVLSEEELEIEGIVNLRCIDVRKGLALISDRFFGHPSSKLKVIGVTGTNGKTTTTYLLRSIFSTAGKKTGLIGTINYLIDENCIPASNTTPESRDLQEMLSKMVDKNIDIVVMEVSSHAVVLSRIEGIEYQAGVFTNFSQDHLDFHGDMETYFSAKRRFFENLSQQIKKPWVVFNIDDSRGEEIKRASGDCPSISYGISTGDIYTSNIVLHQNGISFYIHWKTEKIPIEVKLPGRHNVYNALSAFATAFIQDISPDVIRDGLMRVQSVDGRFEKIEAGQPFSVIIDYAHTPEALERLLLTTKEIITGKLILIFGCGGDRDKKKRPIMGAIGSKLADHTILTSDNPRTEEPEAILSEIEKGIIPDRSYEVIEDRREAIRKGCLIAKSGDCVLIAGKGHENYQILGTKRIPFDDREIALEILRELATNGTDEN